MRNTCTSPLFIVNVSVAIANRVETGRATFTSFQVHTDDIVLPPKKPSHLSYFSVGQIWGSSHLAQKHVASFRHQRPINQLDQYFSSTCISYLERTDKNTSTCTANQRCHIPVQWVFEWLTYLN